MQRPRRSIFMMMVPIIVGVTAACSSSASTSKNTHATAAKLCGNGTVSIGMAKAKTGGFAFFDSAGANGVQIAVDQINSSGGVDGCKFKVTWQDTQSSPAVAAQVAKSLITGGAKILVLPGDFDLGVDASLAAKAARIFAISPEAGTEDWGKVAGPYFVVGTTTTQLFGRGQGVFANKQAWKSAYTVTNQGFSLFGLELAAFKTAFKGTIVGASSVSDTATDYSAVISRIRSVSPAPALIYLGDYFPHVGTFLKQLQGAGLNIPVLGNLTAASPQLSRVVPTTELSRFYYVTQVYYEGPGAAPQVADFVKRYENKFGHFPENANAVNGYEGMLLVLDAIKRADTTAAAKLTAAITGQTNIQQPGSTIYDWTNLVPERSLSVVGFTSGGDARLVATLDPRKG